jgi:ferric-chelate reductase
VVRVSLRRSLLRARPGTHAFLGIPSIRAFETHPFTIVSSSSKGIEFFAKAHNGFTTALHKYAVENPACTVRTSVDGPYGALPDFQSFDKTILIAGDSGGSFAFGVASKLVPSLRPGQTLDFFWIVRTTSALEWFPSELTDLQANPAVNVSVYVVGRIASLTISGNKSNSEISPPGSAFIEYQEKKAVALRPGKDVDEARMSMTPPLPLQFNHPLQPWRFILGDQRSVA